jgi:hypothetical protein
MTGGRERKRMPFSSSSISTRSSFSSALMRLCTCRAFVPCWQALDEPFRLFDLLLLIAERRGLVRSPFFASGHGEV